MTHLTVHPGVPEAPADPRRCLKASHEAWALVAAAFDCALEVDGLTVDDRARFTRCRARARRLAGRRTLEARS